MSQGASDTLVALEAAVAHRPADLEQRVALGFELLDLQRWAAARAVFLTVLRQHPCQFGATLGLAKVARGVGRRAEALAFARQAAVLDPGEAGVQLDIAFDLLQLDRLDAAEAVLSRLDAAPHPPAVAAGTQIGLGHLARRRGARRAAMHRFQAALVLAPDNVEAMLEVASELCEAGAPQAALPLVESALHRAPAHLNALMQRARLARDDGDPVLAEQCLLRVRAAHPSYVQALVDLADLRRTQGHAAAAIALLHDALTAEPDHLEALLSLADLAWLAQDYPRCLALSEQAARAHPDSMAPPLQATRALMELGRTEAALAALAPLEATQGAHPALVARKSEILQAGGAWAEAAATLQTADGDDTAPDDFGLWLQRVRLALTVGRHADAAALLEHPPARDAAQRGLAGLFRGQLAEARWDFAAARDIYLAALDGNPNAAWLHAELARVCLLLCDLDACRHHTAAALQRDAAVHRLRGQSLNPSSTHVGQILDEFRMDPARTAQLRELLDREPADRVAPLLAMQRSAPDHTPTAMMLAIALRQAGRIGRVPDPDPMRPIPRSIVQYWDDTDPPDEIASLMQGWKMRHPDYAYRRFTLDDAGCYLRDNHPADVVQAFVRASFPAQKADIFRLAYLAREGGVYVDADDRCLGHLSAILPQGASFVAWQEHFGTLGNNLLAAAPGLAVLQRATALAATAVNRGDEDIPWLATGPGLLTRAWTQILSEAADPSEALRGTSVLDRAETTEVALFHQFAGYKRTARYWMRAAMGAQAPDASLVV